RDRARDAEHGAGAAHRLRGDARAEARGRRRGLRPRRRHLRRVLRDVRRRLEGASGGRRDPRLPPGAHRHIAGHPHRGAPEGRAAVIRRPGYDFGVDQAAMSSVPTLKPVFFGMFAELRSSSTAWNASASWKLNLARPSGFADIFALDSDTVTARTTSSA